MKRIMGLLLAAALVAVASLATTASALADSAPAQRLIDATAVLQQFVNIPENKIPSALLRQAYGIAVIPSVFKIGFLGAVQRGKGVLAVRTDNGHWSDPTFITLTGGSFGFQAGISSTDIILVFKTRRSVDQIANGQFTLGADASVAAGPVGRQAAAATNLDFNAEVYSYSRSRGLFGGVAINGARIGIDKEANWLYYNKAGIKARTLLSRKGGSNLPKSGQQFVYTLNQYMPPSNDPFHYNSNTGGGSTGQSGAGQNGGNQNGADQNGQIHPYNSGHGGITVQQTGPSGSAGGGNNGTASGDYGSGSYGQGGSRPPAAGGGG